MDKDEMKQYQKELKKHGLHWCSECRNSEHDNINDDVRLCIVRDGHHIILRAYLCADHVWCFMDDGYNVQCY